ncbi:Calcineurin_regulatory subunit B [Hexamita inflata]|uniref:Calcineurin regulatory subunit B n=2 Tax=Hexamita inflata TaxID=28002 RepID=A0AA86URG2_9EUKA|nr:Calcineurin regulatory subunit B [Hexamita inflata]
MASKLLSCQYHKSKLICKCWCGTVRKYLFARDLLLPLQLLLCSLLSTLFRDCQNKLLHSLLVIDTVQNCIRRSQRKTCLDRFYQLSGNAKFIVKSKLQQIPELQLNPLSSRIAELFVDQSDNEGISFKSFVQNLAVFSHQSTEEEKLRFLFRVYDRDNDGKINEDELYNILKQCVGNNIEDQQLKMLVKGTIQDADKNEDAALDYIEFRQCVERNAGMKEKLTVRF